MPRVLGRRNQIKEACQSFTRSAELSYGAPTDDLTNNQSIASHKSRHDEEQRIYLTSIGIRNSGTGDIFHLAKGSQLAEPALSPGNTNDEVSERWRRSSPKIVVIDDFLTNEALDGVRRFCWGGLEVIRDDPEKDFGVLDLPKWYFPSSFYMLQQACHSRPIAQGDTSRDVVVSLRDQLETRDLQAQQRQLAAAKNKYIVINRYNMGLFFPWDHTRDGRRDQYLLTYPTVYDGPDLTVLRVY